jgi:Right handed beta helix region
MKTTHGLILLFLLCFFWQTLYSQDIYVSKTGNDSNPGTKEKPVATLTAAQNLIRQYKSIHDLPDGGLNVWISAGEYEQRQAFVLNENDGGEPGKPITWRAEKGQEVHITGGMRIPGEKFTALTAKQIIKQLRPGVASRLVQVNLKTLGVSDFGKHAQYGHGHAVKEAPLELFFNHQPMTLARYPNQGFMKIGKVIDPGSVPRTGDYNERGAVFTYTDPRHKAWAGLKDIWFQGTFNYGFADDMIPVASIDTSQNQVKLAAPHLYGVAGGKDFQQYFAQNILSELDTAGEWYLDRASGILYLFPPGELQTATVHISLLADPIVCLEGVSHLVFRDVTVEVGRGIGIYMERGAHNLIAGCTVRNVGTNGIFMGQGAQQTFPHLTIDDYEGVPISRKIGNLQGHIYKYSTWERQAGTHHGVQSCDVYNTGSGGIYLSGGSKRKLIPGHNVVENCKVHDYNRRNKFLWAGINIDGCGNRIAHCEIYNSDWQGIFVYGNEHVFEYNHIHHVTLNSDDTSPWYIGRNPSSRGHIVRYNYFHDCGSANRMNMGIYCDDSSTGVTVEGNVFVNMQTSHGVLFSNTGWDLTMKNNIIVNPLTYTAEISAHYYTWAAVHAVPMFGEKGLLRKRLLQEVNILEPPYSTHYPELKDYLNPIIEGKEWEGMRSKRNVVADNVIVGSKEKPVHLLGGQHAVCEDRNNLVISSDPGFVDFKNGNFQLRSDAQVFKMIPHFKPIPFDKMGLYADELRK